MAKINPQDYANNSSSNNQSNGSETQERKDVTTAGVKVLQPAAASFRTTMSGKPQLEIAFACLESMDHPMLENGGLYMEKFSLSEGAMWRIGNFANSIGYSTPFDPEHGPDVLALIAAAKPFRAKLEEREWNDKTYLQIKFFDGWRGAATDEQKKLVSSCGKRYNALVKSRVDNGWEVTPIKAAEVNPLDESGGWDDPAGAEDIPF